MPPESRTDRVLKPRRSYEAGHRPKFLVVIDGTEECGRAVHFAARRALRVGAGLVMLAVTEPPQDAPNWLGVGDLMRAEAAEEADKLLDAAAGHVRVVAEIEPERLIREGVKSEEVVRLIEEDEDISLLVLAAGSDAEGPGPLVAMLAGKGGGGFPIPVAVVPGGLGEAEIDALA